MMSAKINVHWTVQEVSAWVSSFWSHCLTCTAAILTKFPQFILSLLHSSASSFQKSVVLRYSGMRFSRTCRNTQRQSYSVPTIYSSTLISSVSARVRFWSYKSSLEECTISVQIVLRESLQKKTKRAMSYHMTKLQILGQLLSNPRRSATV